MIRTLRPVHRCSRLIQSFGSSIKLRNSSYSYGTFTPAQHFSQLMLRTSYIYGKPRTQTSGRAGHQILMLNFNVRMLSSTEDLPEVEYHEVADNLLESLEPTLADLQMHVKSGDFDVVCSQGVLTMELGTHGTWVVNKQTPNRQIWWSSPLSGPKRYNYDRTTCTWRNTKDGHNMLDLLRKEIKETLDVDIDISL